MGSHCGTQQLYAVQRVAISQLSIMKCIVSQYLSNCWRLGQSRLQQNAASAGGSGQSAVCLQWSAWPRLRILIRCCSSRHIYPLPCSTAGHCSTAALQRVMDTASVFIQNIRTQPGLSSHKTHGSEFRLILQRSNSQQCED